MCFKIRVELRVINIDRLQCKIKLIFTLLESNNQMIKKMIIFAAT